MSYSPCTRAGRSSTSISVRASRTPAVAKRLIQQVVTRYKLPYLSLTPTFSTCPDHGYIRGEHFTCPCCGAETEVWSRITDLTLNIYARARQERLAEIAEKVGENAHFELKGDTSTARIQVTDRSQHQRRIGDTARKSSQAKPLACFEEWWRRRESNQSRPIAAKRLDTDRTQTDSGHKSNTSNTLNAETQNPENFDFDSSQTVSGQNPDTVEGQFCDLCVAPSSEGSTAGLSVMDPSHAAQEVTEGADLDRLELVVTRWPRLSQNVQDSILTIILTAVGSR
jgi:hypothetical protein